MQTIAGNAYVAAAPAQRPFGLRLLGWLVALDAGYRDAHRLANATDAQLADMGLSRTEADAEAARHLGTVSHGQPTAACW